MSEKVEVGPYLGGAVSLHLSCDGEIMNFCDQRHGVRSEPSLREGRGVLASPARGRSASQSRAGARLPSQGAGMGAWSQSASRTNGTGGGRGDEGHCPPQHAKFPTERRVTLVYARGGGVATRDTRASQR